MNCQISKEYISQFLDNEFPSEHLPSMFWHLAECEECRTFFTQTKTMQHAMNQLPKINPSASVDQKFAVLGMEEKKSLMGRKFTISVPSAMLSGILMFMFSLLFVFSLGNFLTYISHGGQKPEVIYNKPETLQMPYYN